MVSDNKRDIYQGADDGWTRAIELVATPVFAGGIGFGIDHIVGTLPLFTIAFGLLAVIASFVKMYFTYDAEMRAHEAASVWGGAERARQAAATATATATVAAAARATAATTADPPAVKQRSAAGLGGS